MCYTNQLGMPSKDFFKWYESISLGSEDSRYGSRDRGQGHCLPNTNLLQSLRNSANQWAKLNTICTFSHNNQLFLLCVDSRSAVVESGM